MKPELWALLTALCWAIGSFLEKKGVKLGNFTPVMGTTIRTLVSLVFLGLISLPYWSQVKAAGPKPVLLIAVGGGILAGGLGLIFLYTGLRTGSISTVMAVAFCMAPVFGAVIGLTVLREPLTLLQITGIVLCVIGAAMTVLFKAAPQGG